MLENLIGEKFGRLTVIEEADSNIKYRRAWRCKCECGNTKYVIVSTGELKSGREAFATMRVTMFAERRQTRRCFLTRRRFETADTSKNITMVFTVDSIKRD